LDVKQGEEPWAKGDRRFRKDVVSKDVKTIIVK
jgi:hypothetical protein